MHELSTPKAQVSFSTITSRRVSHKGHGAPRNKQTRSALRTPMTTPETPTNRQYKSAKSPYPSFPIFVDVRRYSEFLVFVYEWAKPPAGGGGAC